MRVYHKTIQLVSICSLLNFTVAVGQNVNTHAISKDTISPKIDSLKPVIVTASPRPRLKGDTVEFNTEKQALKPNAVVEELLRRLPGLQIDLNGVITFNGERIQHLLVDGEDIFGNDPTLVTRNFDAGKIARVQILDRKSDRAVFTGVDDGTRTKTLNLVLKETAKDGYFGKAEAGGNNNGYYNANGAIAAFRHKEQFTSLLFASNTGGLEFTSGSGGGGSTSISFLNGNADALGASAGTGIPRFEATALHYANYWDQHDDHLAMNYQYSHYYTQPITSTQIIQNLTNGAYKQQQQSHSVNQQYQHWAYGTYDLNANANSSWRFVFHGSSSTAQNQLDDNGTGILNTTLLNNSLRAIHDKVTRSNIGGDVSWRLRVGAKSGQALSMSAGFTKNDVSTNGQVYSVNRYYQPAGILQSSDTIDQRKQIATHSLNLNSSLSFTEPLWKGAVLALGSRIDYTNDDPLQATFNRSNGKYELLVDSLSTHLKTVTVGLNENLNVQGQINKLKYLAGIGWVAFSYRQRGVLNDSLLRLRYLNWIPMAILQYAVTPESGLRFEYNESTQQPSITQLQSEKNNTDPMHIILGNPALRPGLEENFKLDYSRFRTWTVNVGLNFKVNVNAISTKTMTDSLGRQTTQPVNINGGTSAGLNFSAYRKVSDINVGIYINSSTIRSMNNVNYVQVTNNSYSYSSGFDLNKYVENKFSFQWNANFGYFSQKSNFNTAIPIHYWSQNHSCSITVLFFRNIEINSNASYTWQEKTSALGAEPSLLIWNMYFSRTFLTNNLVIKCQFNNIMDRISGISRSSTDNINTQTSTNILGRNWMISATYHFDKKFKSR